MFKYSIDTNVSYVCILSGYVNFIAKIDNIKGLYIKYAK